MASPSTETSRRRLNIETEAWIVAPLTAGLVVFYAMRNGTYDVVDRGEVGILIWVGLGIGWATGVLPRARPSRLLWVCIGGFGVMVLWTVICLSWTASDERTVVELGRIAHHAGIFLLAASLITRRTHRPVIAGIAAGAALVSWLGLANWIWPGSITNDVVRSVFRAERLSYPLDYWNGMAAFGAMATVACLAMATHARTTLARALFAVPIPGIVLMAYLTYSRGGAFEMAIGLVVLLAFARHRFVLILQCLPLAGASALAILTVRDHEDLVHGTGSVGAGSVMTILIVGGAIGSAIAVALHALKADSRLRLPERVARGGAVAGAAVLLIATVIAGPSLYREVRDSFNRPAVGSVDNPTARFANLGGARKAQFEDAIDSWKDHPVQGTGPGTYEFTWSRSPEYGGFVRDVHNVYLEALAESGIPGFLALLVVLVAGAAAAVLSVVRARTPARRGAAAASCALLAIWLFAAGVDWMWELTVITVVPLIAAGAATGALASERSGQRRRRWLRIGRRIGVPVAAIVSLIVLLPPVVSTSQIRKSQASARAGDTAAALRHADDAIDSAPWSASAMTQKSLLLEEAGRLDAAEGYAVLAFDREPENWRRALLRARLLAERGDAQGAIEWYRRAKALAPNNPALP